MKTLASLAVCIGLGFAFPATADASLPLLQDRLDAKRFAGNWWEARGEAPNCSGVRLRWRSWRYEPGIRGKLAYVNTQRDCTIVFNSEVNWARVPESTPGETTFLGEQWWRFCATAIHEWGHLRGMPFRTPPVHSRSRNSIMAATEGLNTRAWWWPFFPGCSYKGDGVYDDTEDEPTVARPSRVRQPTETS